MSRTKLTPAHATALLESVDSILLDCDGVIWTGNKGINGAKEAIDRFRSLGKNVFFVTNNSTKSRDVYLSKFHNMGIQAKLEDIVSSASATAAYMSNLDIGKKVYVIGETGVFEELRAVGFEPLGQEDGSKQCPPEMSEVDQEISAVVVGLDRQISYYKMGYAALCLRYLPGCKFISTNGDSTIPSNGILLPGGGSMCKTIECCTDRSPDVTIGKPSQALLQSVCAKYGLNPERTCMVGDRLNTDIEFGNTGGLKTLLVMSGVTSEEELRKNENPIYDPDYVAPSLAAFMEE